MTHDMFSLVFDDRLIFPEITPLRRVLDCGTGTANWAVEVARREPQCQVRLVPLHCLVILSRWPPGSHVENGYTSNFESVATGECSAGCV